MFSVYSGFGLERFSVYSEFGLDRFSVYSGFGLDRFSVYSGFGLDRFSVYSGFGLDRFHCILYLLLVNGQRRIGVVRPESVCGRGNFMSGPDSRERQALGVDLTVREVQLCKTVKQKALYSC